MNIKTALALLLVIAAIAWANSLGLTAPQSSSGVEQAKQKIHVDPKTGMTTEQGNIADRLRTDNRPGSVKHLYVVGYNSGTVLLYSTVKGKVTSGGKRLTPVSTIEKYKCGDNTCYEGQRVIVGGQSVLTTEIVQDDGTYGSSAPYLYWHDSHGRYHQHFFTDGQVIHIADQPLSVGRIVINAEIAEAPNTGE